MKKVLFLVGGLVVLLSAVGCKRTGDTGTGTTPPAQVRPECKDGVCPVQKAQAVPEVPTVQGEVTAEEAAMRHPIRNFFQRRHKKTGDE